MDLTIKERVIIANQLKILEIIDADNAIYYARHRKAIESGYKLHYSWVAEAIDENEMSEEDCQEVLNVLDMYRAITASFERIKECSSLKQSDIRFKGYDGNNEGNQYAYTNYFITDLDRFNELCLGSKYPDFNSHCPRRQKYSKMLDIWNKFPNKFELSEDQIKELLGV